MRQRLVAAESLWGFSPSWPVCPGLPGISSFCFVLMDMMLGDDFANDEPGVQGLDCPSSIGFSSASIGLSARTVAAFFCHLLLGNGFESSKLTSQRLIKS